MAEAFEISIADGFDVGFDVGVMKLTELRYLAKSLSKDEPKKESAEIADTSKNQPPSMNNEQSYGNPLSPAEAVQAVPSGSDGLIRFATVVPDKFCVNGTLVVEGLNSRDFDAEKGIIKPRRPSLPITQTDLMSSLTVVDGEEGPRYIFNGILNGWPSLRNFELVGLAKKRRMSLPGGVKTPDYMINAINMVGKGWVTYWRADDQGKKGNFYRRNTCREVIQFVLSLLSCCESYRCSSFHSNHFSHQQFPPYSLRGVKFAEPHSVELLGVLLAGLQRVQGFCSGSKRNVLKALVSSMDLIL